MFSTTLLPGMMTKDDDDVSDLTKDDDVSDWTKGLPSSEELTPLSHSLISRVLASAFRIKHEEPMTAEDVRRESQASFHNLFKQKPTPSFDAFPAFQEQQDAGGHVYEMDGRRMEEESRGKRRLEKDQFRGVRIEEEFRGNLRVEEEYREDFRGNRRVEERRDGRAHAVEDRVDYRGVFRSEIPRHPSASGNDTTGSGKGGVKSNARAQGVQSSATNTAINTGREYFSTPSKPGYDTNTAHEHRTERPGQSSLPYTMNALPYGPYEARAEAGSYGGREEESSRGADFELEDDNSVEAPVTSNEDANAKRVRLVWTPQLHKRFVEAVGLLGIKNAVPKTIMQLMNVEGLTREKVASHLQKYRLYLKRAMQGLSPDEPSASDHLFASTPLPPGMSPHFMPNSSCRDDGGVSFTTPILPMPFPGLLRPGHFGGYEHMPYGPMAGGFMQPTPMPDPRVAVNVSENESQSHASLTRNNNHRSQSHQGNQNQPSSSSQCALPLFPTNETRR